MSSAATRPVDPATIFDFVAGGPVYGAIGIALDDFGNPIPVSATQATAGSSQYQQTNAAALLALLFGILLLVWVSKHVSFKNWWEQGISFK